MADEAVLDAPVLELDTNSVDADVSSTNDKETPETTADTTAEVAEVKGDERRLPADIRAKKHTDPVAFKKEKDEFFADLADRDTFGEQAKQIKSFLEEKGGVEGISQVISDLEAQGQELTAIQQAIETGDARIIDRVPAESIGKLAPAMNQKWAEADPDGWAAAMSGVMASTINQAGIPMFLERMSLMLEFGKTEDVKAAVGQLKGWMEEFGKRATAQPQQQRTPDKLNEREQQLNQRDQELFDSDVRRDVDSFREPLIAQKLAEYIARRPNDADAKELAISDVRAKVVARMSGDKDFQKKLIALTSRRDKEGALRLIKSRETAAIDEIAPRVGRAVFGQPSATPAPRPQPARPAVPKAPLRAKDKFDEIWNNA